MANSNNICTRFINYAAVLILLCFSSLSFAYTGSGGQFGGGGAFGDWDEPEKCEPKMILKWGRTPEVPLTHDSISSACRAVASAFGQSYTSYDSVTSSSAMCRTRNSNGSSDQWLISGSQVSNPNYDPTCQEKCPAGYEKDANGKCQPKKCPVGQTLVNGQCQPKKCPAGQALDKNGQCFAPDDSCPAGQKKVNGRCITPPPDEPDPDPNSEWPPFCEWASVMCKWHEEWQQWSNDYAANEEKANLDREELKRIGLDSKENLDEINQKMTEQNQKLDEHKIKLDEIKQQDKDYYEQDLQQNNDFYDDARDFFDWYKGQSTENPTDPNDPENPENQDGNVAVNQEQIPLDESQRITFVNACPPDQQFTINFMGRSQTLGFSYQPLCQFMTMIRPFVIAIAYLIGAYILMGLSRGSSE